MRIQSIEKVTQEALGLPLDERAKLARILIDSIGEGSEEEVSAAWDIELQERVRDIREGKVQGIPAEEVFRKLEAKYH